MIQIFVRGWDGKQVVLGVKYALTLHTKVRRVKEIITELTGILPDDNILIYATKQLSKDKDDLPLGEFGIQNGSTLMMAGRLRGGAIIDLRVILVNQEEVKVQVDE